MVLGQRNNPIEALPAQCSNEPFAQRIRLRAPHRRCDDLKIEVHERLIGELRIGDADGGEFCQPAQMRPPRVAHGRCIEEEPLGVQR